MSTSTEWCSQCGAYHVPDSHLPVYSVSSEEGGDCTEFNARNHEDAAERFASQWAGEGDGIPYRAWVSLDGVTKVFEFEAVIRAWETSP